MRIKRRGPTQTTGQKSGMRYLSGAGSGYAGHVFTALACNGGEHQGAWQHRRRWSLTVS